MANEHHSLWERIGINIPRLEQMRVGGGEAFKRIVLSRGARPRAMAYFDDFMRGLQTRRIQELQDFRDEGGKVVGIFCVFVPEDLILAAGAVPVGLCSGSPATIDSANKVLPLNSCALVKSSYGFEMDKVCPFSLVSDLIIGETTCDGKKKMYELFGLLRDIYVMEVPQKQTEGAFSLFLSELSELRCVLECLTCNAITAESLAEATRLHEAKREAMARIARTRRAPNPPINGVDALFVNQLSFADDTERFISRASELAEELESRVAAGVGAYETPGPRILITGCPMALPNWKLPHLIEASGAMVVGEESCVGSRYYEPRAASSDRSLDAQLQAIARRQLATPCPSFTPNDQRVDDVVRLAREYEVDGVIQYTLQFCHTFAHEAVKLDAALDEAGIPSLQLETDYSPQDTEQLRLRIEAFLETLGHSVPAPS